MRYGIICVCFSPRSNWNSFKSVLRKWRWGVVRLIHVYEFTVYPPPSPVSHSFFESSICGQRIWIAIVQNFRSSERWYVTNTLISVNKFHIPLVKMLLGNESSIQFLQRAAAPILEKVDGEIFFRECYLQYSRIDFIPGGRADYICRQQAGGVKYLASTFPRSKSW